MTRRVVLICGPPGSGKTTVARALGLEVYDRDDPHWRSERQFTAALAKVALDPSAQAAVIRSGASLSARQKAADLCRATELQLLLVDAQTCIDRAVRRRQGSGGRTQAAAVRTWWGRFQPGDVILGRSRPGVAKARTTAEKGLGREWQRLTDRARKHYPWVCHLCNLPIRTRREWTLDHLNPRSKVGAAVPPLERTRPAHRTCNSRRGARPVTQSRRTESW